MNAIKIAPCEEDSKNSNTTAAAVSEIHQNEKELSQHISKVDNGVTPPKTVHYCPRCKTPCSYRADQRLWRCTKYFLLPKTKKRKYCNFTVKERTVNNDATCEVTKHFKTIVKFNENNELSENSSTAGGGLSKTVQCPNCKTLCSYREDERVWYCTNSFFIPETRKRKFCSFKVKEKMSTTTIDSCESCTNKYFETIAKFHENEDLSRNFLRAHGILPKTVNCPRCKSPCTYREASCLWRCTKYFLVPQTKKRKYCNFSVSDNKGTFLEKAKISRWKVVLFVNHFLSHLWDNRTIRENFDFSQNCTIDWRSFCSDVCEHWVKHQDPIGGEGIAVDIDETSIVRRQRNSQENDVSKIWLFGGVDRISKRSFVISLSEDFDPNDFEKEYILLPLIKKLILPGSIIYSDCKKTYGNLQEEDYIHFMINTSEENEEDEEEPNIHSRNIQDLWLDIKHFVMKPGNRHKYINQYLARYMFIKNENDTTKLLHKFFKRAAMLYKHPSVEEEQQQPAESNV